MDAAERNDRTLRRIMATLVAFAVLAEGAAGRSFPVRWLVLLILRQAEHVAQVYVADVTWTDWPCPDHPSGLGNGPADAFCLAARFRALAAMLSFLLPAARRFGRRHAPIDRAPRRPAPRGRLLPTPGGPARWYCDTS